MAQVNQDFITFAGDAVSPIFTVQDASGAAVNISSVSDISWTARRNLTDAAVLTKSKTGGAITFVTDGSNGQFKVSLTSADTTSLTGWYVHVATITDGNGNITTVTVGRMQVGVAPNWTWDEGSVGVEPLYTVRQLIGDTIQSDQLQSDQQIKWALGVYSNEWLAAAECCRNIAAKFARQVDIVEGQLKTNYSQRAKTYRSLAMELEQRGFSRGAITAYTGGTSLIDKSNNATATDRVPPQFVIGMFDDLLPVAPVGHQTGAGQGLPDSQSDVDILAGP